MPLVVGVDSSTQATKVEVRDLDDGTLVATGRAPHPPTTHPGRPGVSDADPERWWDALGDAIGAALGAPDVDRAAVAAISVAGQQHGMVALDAHDRPLVTPPLWNDTRSAPEASALTLTQGAHWWARRCGSVPVAAFTVTKLAWLAAHDPEALERLRTVLLPHDWLTWRLTGRIVTDRGDASGTGWWSPAEGSWVPDALGAAMTVGYEAALLAAELGEGALPDPARWPHPADLAARLPDVLGPSEPAGTLRPATAAALGLPERVVVGPGTGDNMAAALGAGLRPGDLAISLGTSGTAYALADEPTADATGAVAGFADASGRFLPLVCTLNATQVTDAVARLLGVDHDRFDELASSAPLGADGLVLIPYLAGERTPDRPDATGVLHGIRTDVSRPALARAAVEGVVCGLLDGVDALAGAGVPVDDGRLVVVGGGSRSPAYRRVLADLAHRVVVVPAGDEHVARGACVQAAAVLTGTDPAEVAAAWSPAIAAMVEPGPDAPAGAEVRARYASARG